MRMYGSLNWVGAVGMRATGRRCDLAALEQQLDAWEPIRRRHRRTGARSFGRAADRRGEDRRLGERVAARTAATQTPEDEVAVAVRR
jgi:hypothetical protein